MSVSAEGLPFRPAIQIDIAHARVFEPTFLHARVDADIIMDDDASLMEAGAGFWRSLEREYSALGVEASVHLPFHGVNLGSRSSLARDLSAALLEKGLEAAAELGARTAVMHTGFVPLMPSKAVRKWFSAFMRGFEGILRAAERLGVTIAVENTWERTPRLFERMREAAGKSFRYCLDIGHCSVYSEVSLSEWMEFMGSDIAVVHLHDNDGREDRHLPPGAGTLDFSPLVGLLRSGSVRVVLETKPRHLQAELLFLHRILKEDTPEIPAWKNPQ